MSASPPQGKKHELSGVGKRLKETRLGVVPWWATQASSTETKGSRVGDSELRRTNHCVHPLVSLLVFLRTDLLK
jgi:hypothetical protein